MPKQLQKSLQFYLSRIKRSSSRRFHLQSKTVSSSTSWILKGCIHPKTPSFAVNSKEAKRPPRRSSNDDGDDDESATLSDIDRFLFENFRSLFLQENDGGDIKGRNRGDKGGGDDEDHDDDEEKVPGGVMFKESPRFLDLPPNRRGGGGGARRFFIDRSFSGSLIEEARASMTATTTSEDIASNSNSSTTPSSTGETKNMGPDDFVTLIKYSPNPYDDFRSSMLEMIEARLQSQGKVDWEFLEELLFCYLNVNDKKSYKFILSAFVDLVAGLRERSGNVPAKPRNGPSTGGDEIVA